jgi:hypothetical protein
MSMEHGDYYQEEIEDIGEKVAPVSLRPRGTNIT